MQWDLELEIQIHGTGSEKVKMIFSSRRFLKKMNKPILLCYFETPG